jgi:predicted nucleotidyltransferase
MEPTNDAYINLLLADLLARLQRTLSDKFVGLYLHGSLVTGDFDAHLSDIDLLAALSDDLTGVDLEALRQMHGDFVAQYPQWDDRIEVAYLSLKALRTFKTQRSRIGIISPGEPLHFVEAGIDWLMNWYMVQEKGVTLLGPEPETIIDPISRDEFIEAIRQHVSGWNEYVEHGQHRGFQAYTILTMCRGLYTLSHGEQVSKIKAAEWAMGYVPEWAGLIQKALEWRQDILQSGVIDDAALPETKRFVAAMVERVQREYG